MDNSPETVMMTVMLPSNSRAFPTELEYMLPLRHSMKQYESNLGRVVTSNISSESDGDGLTGGRIYTMAVFPPIVGHASVVNGTLTTCEAGYADVHDHEMADVASRLPVTTIKWLIGPSPNDVYPMGVATESMMMRASSIYENGGPLSSYDNHAVVESMNHSSPSSFWQNLYPTLESVECHYGMIGIIHDNITISLGDAVGDYNDLNMAERIPKTEHMGWTPATRPHRRPAARLKPSHSPSRRGQGRSGPSR